MIYCHVMYKKESWPLGGVVDLGDLLQGIRLLPRSAKVLPYCLIFREYLRVMLITKLNMDV